MRLRAAVAALCLLAQGLHAAPSSLPSPRPDRPVAEASDRLRGPAPKLRPARRHVTAAPTAGGLCGDARLAGRALAPIRGPGGCGVANPVRLRSAAGVALTPPADIDCAAARAVADWVETALQPAAAAQGGATVTRLHVAAGYACRRVNNRPSGRLSQHAKGKAIDISGFTLSDGRAVTLIAGWNGRDGALLRQAWQGACGPFGTVLGPEADRWHRDHFHFDTARYSSGPYCH